MGPLLLALALPTGGCGDEENRGISTGSGDEANKEAPAGDGDEGPKDEPIDLSAWNGAVRLEVVKSPVTSEVHQRDAKAPAAGAVNFAIREGGGFVQYFAEVHADSEYEALLRGSGPDYAVLLRRIGTAAPTAAPSLFAFYWSLPGAENFFLGSIEGREDARLTLHVQNDPSAPPQLVANAQVAGAPDSDCSGFTRCATSADCGGSGSICVAAFQDRCVATCLSREYACTSECKTTSCTVDPGDVAQLRCQGDDDEPQAVWMHGDTSFVFKSVGGFHAYEPDAGCTGHDLTITFTAPASVVSQGCRGDTNADFSLELSENQQQELTSILGAMKTTHMAWCTADAPVDTLTIYGATGSGRVYDSATNHGCTAGLPPGTVLIDFTDPTNAFLSFMQGLTSTPD